MDVNQESLKLHEELRGRSKWWPAGTSRPGTTCPFCIPPACRACREIAKDYEKSFTLTRRGNLVAVITDGSAVLGLGDIGPAAGMPVMEASAPSSRSSAGWTLPHLRGHQGRGQAGGDHRLISKSFGGINLEDIAAPRCFELSAA